MSLDIFYLFWVFEVFKLIGYKKVVVLGGFIYWFRLLRVNIDYLFIIEVSKIMFGM